MKRVLPAICLILAATTFLGASAWEGSAMMSAYGEFPDSGYYAACNSFPRNTAVEVVNLENGKTITVIVTKGLDNPGIFLLLSPEAAKSLAMEPGSVSRVRVSSPRNITEAVSSSSSSGDPDFNPSLLASKSSEPASPIVRNPPVADTPASVAPPTAVALQEPVETGAAEAEPAQKGALLPPDSITPQVSQNNGELNAREEPIVLPESIVRSDVSPLARREAVASIDPPDSREAPEENAEVYGVEKPSALGQPVQTVLAEPALVPDELPEAAQLRKTWPVEADPSVGLADCEIRMEDTDKPQALALADIGPEKKSEPAVTLEPTEANPPEAAAIQSASVVAAAPEKSPAKAPSSATEAKPRSGKEAATVVQPGKYYIQVGAYKSYTSVDAAAKALSDSFPVTIETSKSGSSALYRLFIGPLGRDETGVILVRVRSLGYKDAFLKH